MRHAPGNRRQRSRNNGRRNNNGGGAPNRSQVFDSNGPDVRIRGTAHQIVEKYQALAKDATSSSDYTLAQNYLQHAEHYQRIITEWDEIDRARQANQQANQAQKEQRQNNDQQKRHNNNNKPSADKKLEAEGNGNDSSAEKKPMEIEDLGLPASLLPKAPVEAIEAVKEEENA